MKNNAHTANMNWETEWQPECWAAVATHKESQLKLRLETRNQTDIIIVHCQGRIVYRDEAAALSRLVSEFITANGRVVLDLSGVKSIDSAGIGELAFLQSLAQSHHAELKYAGVTGVVRELLNLTNLNSVLEIHPSVCEALAAFHPGAVFADC
jgi:anti-anti-sigma factor